MKKPTTQIGARLLKILNEKGISMRAASLGAGLSESAAKHVIYGSSQSPRLTTISQIAAYLDIPTSEITGSDAQQKNAVTPVHTTQIEVRGDVQAGVWRDAMEWPRADWYAITVPLDAAYAGLHRYGLLVKGDSMNKVFPDGSIVVVINLVDLGRMPMTGEIVVAVQRSKVSDDFEATVKAVQVLESGEMILWPQSTNPDFATPVRVPPIRGDHDAGMPDVFIQALVVASYRPKPMVSFG
ncbi:LexA family transcriptional regulator [Gluconobacter sphaericus]|uniref:LexA family protein n=1 Tax=Gluconobacter sphaericus TaxID=574987 RepID=UPI00192512A0|nr:LexA family transcriptional regulator [Gluconobacter sphaericus]QQX91313.1 LexA family transcriptional regulator [Gluconobacter sphaericus]